MSTADLLTLVAKSPEAIVSLCVVGTLASSAIGLAGTAIELVGDKASLPRVEKFGQRLEAFGKDFPKLWRGSRYTAEIDQRVNSILSRGPGG